MSGELQLQGQAAAAPAPAAPAATAASSTVVCLKEMLTAKDLAEDDEYEEVLEDTREECAAFGTLKNIVIPREGPGATKIFLEYASTEDAGKAIAGLAGRTFDGRRVEATYFDEAKFANKDYSE